MMSLTFNPLTIALGALTTIFLISVMIPADTWDRMSDWLWPQASEDVPASQRRMPWEKDRG